MDITTIALVCVAVFCIYWAYPKLPEPGQWVLAIIVAIAGVLVLMNYLGVPVSL